MSSKIPDDYQQALSEGWQPIREVSRITGVNPVTLRAWERRYGLIVPGRTGKGHRLYSAEHVARIQAILTWLNRGVAVSQVGQLLEGREPAEQTEDGQWPARIQQMLQSVSQLSERHLHEHFNACTALYPPQTLYEHLLLPLQAQLTERWQAQRFGSSLEQIFWHGWLRSKLGMRVYQHNRQQQGAPLLLISLSGLPLEPDIWLCAWLAAKASACTERPLQVFDWPIAPSELGLALDTLKPAAVLIYSSQRLEASWLRRHLPRLAESAGLPILFGGPAASIHAQDLADVPGLLLFDSPADIAVNLQQLKL